jgi:thioredoxin reductase (NADPH)
MNSGPARAKEIYWTWMPDAPVFDALVIGAGPTGLASAIALKCRGLSTVVLDKGCIVNSLWNYPTNLVFFTTPERLEIGDLPMTSLGEKPVRAEALKYYRRAAEHYGLDIRQWRRVIGLRGSQGDFTVEARDRDGGTETFRARAVVAATGFYDVPVLMGVPGEDLPKVRHYYQEAHPFWNQDVLVVGGANSAVIAALDLARSGARVTLIHRGPVFDACVKYWLKPDIENRIREGSLRAYFHTTLAAVREREADIRGPEGLRTLPNDAVLAMTGYKPDFPFLKSLGVTFDEGAGRPKLGDAFETERKGLFLAGVVVAGVHTSEVFIENGRHHGGLIADAIAARLKDARAA